MTLSSQRRSKKQQVEGLVYKKGKYLKTAGMIISHSSPGDNVVYTNIPWSDGVRLGVCGKDFELSVFGEIFTEMKSPGIETEQKFLEMAASS